MTAQDRTPPGDPDFNGVEAALRRAAARARREAAAAGVAVVVFQDGKIVLEKPGRDAPHPGRGFPNPARDSDG